MDLFARLQNALETETRPLAKGALEKISKAALSAHHQGDDPWQAIQQTFETVVHDMNHWQKEGYHSLAISSYAELEAIHTLFPDKLDLPDKPVKDDIAAQLQAVQKQLQPPAALPELSLSVAPESSLAVPNSQPVLQTLPSQGWDIARTVVHPWRASCVFANAFTSAPVPITGLSVSFIAAGVWTAVNAVTAFSFSPIGILLFMMLGAISTYLSLTGSLILGMSALSNKRGISWPEPPMALPRGAEGIIEKARREAPHAGSHRNQRYLPHKQYAVIAHEDMDGTRIALVQYTPTSAFSHKYTVEVVEEDTFDDDQLVEAAEYRADLQELAQQMESREAARYLDKADKLTAADILGGASKDVMYLLPSKAPEKTAPEETPETVNDTSPQDT